MSGAIGYRAELGGQRSRVVRLAGVAALGGLIGSVLLLTLPDSAFEAIVPALVGLALVLVVVQPRLSRWLDARRSEPRDRDGGTGLLAAMLGASAYGGYFGAAQGILYLAALGIALDDDLQRLNGLKNVLAAIVNGVAAVVFMIVAPVAWLPAALIAVSSIAGAQVGAKVGRRLPAAALRGIIVVVGLVAIAQLVL